MTRIRLSRTGSVHQPHYRIVVSDSHSPRDGKFIEILGSYHPLHQGELVLNKERSAYWISVGAQPSTTLVHLLTKAGVEHPFVVRRKPAKAPKNPVAPKAAAPVAPAAAETADEAVAENPLSDTAAEAQAETVEVTPEEVVETEMATPDEAPAETESTEDAPAEA